LQSLLRLDLDIDARARHPRQFAAKIVAIDQTPRAELVELKIVDAEHVDRLLDQPAQHRCHHGRRLDVMLARRPRELAFEIGPGVRGDEIDVEQIGPIHLPVGIEGAAQQEPAGKCCNLIPFQRRACVDLDGRLDGRVTGKIPPCRQPDDAVRQVRIERPEDSVVA
jgi:hypothetical protein